MICCEVLAGYLAWSCDQHADAWECCDGVIVKHDGRIVIPIHDGGSSYVVLVYCPFCGRKIIEVE